MANTKVWKRLYLREFGGFWKPANIWKEMQQKHTKNKITLRSGPTRFFKPWIANRWLGSLLVGIPTWRNIYMYIYTSYLYISYIYTPLQLQAFSWKVVYVLVVPTPDGVMTIYIYIYPTVPTGISKWRLLKGIQLTTIYDHRGMGLWWGKHLDLLVKTHLPNWFHVSSTLDLMPEACAVEGFKDGIAQQD